MTNTSHTYTDQSKQDNVNDSCLHFHCTYNTRVCFPDDDVRIKACDITSNGLTSALVIATTKNQQQHFKPTCRISNRQGRLSLTRSIEVSTRTPRYRESDTLCCINIDSQPSTEIARGVTQSSVPIVYRPIWGGGEGAHHWSLWSSVLALWNCQLTWHATISCEKYNRHLIGFMQPCLLA